MQRVSQSVCNQVLHIFITVFKVGDCDLSNSTVNVWAQRWTQCLKPVNTVMTASASLEFALIGERLEAASTARSLPQSTVAVSSPLRFPEEKVLQTPIDSS